ncbi:unnamed protein product [Tetraodon nigroviridis]|uniref:Chromosome undetermined SCAF7395, whole genome shotgun sequence n=1 Tax=Tetraodon nigroviridis TaxID=99883 RepID=Q4TA98_TETNG|nr:unnamed protein product [Tetraodon nigroviridis]
MGTVCGTAVVPAKTSPRMSGRQNEHIVPDYPANNKINTREAFRTLNNATDVKKEGLDDQISRLAKLIGRLEDKILFYLPQSLLLIRQEMVVSQKKLAEFCEALKQYLRSVSIQRECFHVTAVRLPDGLSFVIYEFWTGEEEWKQLVPSSGFLLTTGKCLSGQWLNGADLGASCCGQISPTLVNEGIFECICWDTRQQSQYSYKGERTKENNFMVMFGYYCMFR